jgi:hypothetical protein
MKILQLPAYLVATALLLTYVDGLAIPERSLTGTTDQCMVWCRKERVYKCIGTAVSCSNRKITGLQTADSDFVCGYQLPVRKGVRFIPEELACSPPLRLLTQRLCPGLLDLLLAAIRSIRLAGWSV